MLDSDIIVVLDINNFMAIIFEYCHPKAGCAQDLITFSEEILHYVQDDNVKEPNAMTTK